MSAPGATVVIGGGPAGALAAAQLAATGAPVTLVDERLAWEKPCGGGVTAKALEQFPQLQASGCPRNVVRECELISPAGRRALLPLDRPLAIFSRADLNALLLDQARTSGAAILHDRITGAEPGPAGWRLHRRGGGVLDAARLVIASGARTALAGPWTATCREGGWMATVGYYIPLERVPWPSGRMLIRFLPGLEGYLWSFPRTDHASVGACAALGSPPTAALRARLEAALDEMGAEWRGAPFYSHLLPAPTPPALARAQFEGAAPHPWALVGDAAGLVDPLTGEGLYYALRSAALLAGAWNAPAPAAAGVYAARLRRELVPELTAAANLVERFYHARFLGRPALERMAGFAQASPRFRKLMCDLFSGAQGYLGLRARLYRQLLPTLWELAWKS
ncbi:MAG: NAD(P)/FAD-dependent oxidoreductase [Terriglobales bacterium]